MVSRSVSASVLSTPQVHKNNHGSGRQKVEHDCNAAWKDLVRRDVYAPLLRRIKRFREMAVL